MDYLACPICLVAGVCLFIALGGWDAMASLLEKAAAVLLAGLVIVVAVLALAALALAGG